jgi:hypothetical protein
MAHNNGFPEQIVHKLKKKLTTKKKQTMQTQPMQQHNKKWVTFTYHGPSVRKVTNLFKHTNLKIAFRPTNTIYHRHRNPTLPTPVEYNSSNATRVSTPSSPKDR